jgi:hypothetical protein
LQRDNGTLELPANLKGGAAQKAMGKLLTDGFVEEIPAGASMQVWRKDDERAVALRITAAGLAAIEAAPHGSDRLGSSLASPVMPGPCIMLMVAAVR